MVPAHSLLSPHFWMIIRVIGYWLIADLLTNENQTFTGAELISMRSFLRRPSSGGDRRNRGSGILRHLPQGSPHPDCCCSPGISSTVGAAWPPMLESSNQPKS